MSNDDLDEMDRGWLAELAVDAIRTTNENERAEIRKTIHEIRNPGSIGDIEPL